MIDHLWCGALGVEYEVDGVRYRLRLGSDQRHFVKQEVADLFFKTTVPQLKKELTERMEELRKLAVDSKFHGTEEFEV